MNARYNCVPMLFLLGALASTAQLAAGQARGAVNGQAVDNAVTSLARNTPRPVMTGAAHVVSHYNGAQMLRLVLGLRHPYSAAEEQFLVDLQNRDSPLFHRYLTADEWTARFSPSAHDEQAVVNWLTAQGLAVTRRYPSRLIIEVEAPVSTIEKAFGLTINNYQMGSLTFFSNDRDPVVPTGLSGVLESVMGTNNLQVVQPAIKNFKGPIGGNPYTPGPVRSQGAGIQLDALQPIGSTGVKPAITNGFYDPSDIYASTAYDYAALQNLGHCCNPANNPGQTPATTSIAIATFSTPAGTGEYMGGFAQTDIAGFQTQYPSLAFHIAGSIYINGTPAKCCDDETTLDIEWSTAASNSFGSSVNTSYIHPYIGGNNLLTTFAAVFMEVLTDNTTRILSTSWGCAEDCWGGSSGVATMHGITNSLVGQGWTLVASAGDQGATSDCSTISVDYPASDPNVVAAGGTTLVTGPSGYTSEVGWTGGTFSGACSENDGGGGGGCSGIYAAPGYQTSPACGSSHRSLPDMALNANYGQNYYFNGALSGVGGTSIVAPELAGFFAQSAAYMLYVTTLTGSNNSCYGSGTSPCLPLGNGNTYLYYFGNNPSYAYHYPFYDITSGCNSNDVTAANHLTAECARAGYDEVTGWGSANMLQLAWAINTYLIGSSSAPTVAFTGPTTGQWYNTDQTVGWTITGHTSDKNPVNGISGYTAQWDSSITDPTSEATPGSGNAFYSGPATPNSNTGSSDVASVGQGCHTLYVYAWDNTGYPSGNQSYGTVCYDTVPPVTTSSVSGNMTENGVYQGSATVTLSASDPAPGSGVAATYIGFDGNYGRYTSPVTIVIVGTHTLSYYSVDVAGNAGSVKSFSLTIATEVQNPPGSGFEDAFQVSYISQLNNADTVINITNAGSSAGSSTVQSTNNTVGNLCANIYVFDPQEEEVACCSCVVSPNELIYFNAGGPTEGTPNQSVPVSAGGNGNAGLLYNVVNGPGTYSADSAVVKIVATTGSTCVNSVNTNAPSTITAASFSASALAPGLVAYSTHPHPTNGPSPGAGLLPVDITETPFALKPLSASELNFLQYGCTAIASQSTGKGICSCSAKSQAGGFVTQH